MSNNKEGIIYKVTNLVNNKIYIGQTIRTLNTRKTVHIYRAMNNLDGNSYFHAAIRKYKESSFKWEVIWKGNIDLLNDKEIFYIQECSSYYKSNKGYNLTLGGDNPPYFSGENHPQYDHTLYTFYHKNGYIEENITRYNMVKKYSLTSTGIDRVINKEGTTHKKWALSPNVFNRIHNSTDTKLYTFFHEDGTIEKNVTRKYMEINYNLSKAGLNKIINKHPNIYKGWSLSKDRAIKYKPINKKYSFISVDGIIEKNITQHEFSKKYSISNSTISVICNKGKSRRGWKLYNYN